jgi:nucleoside-diphosphate-sugar epimerase
MVNIINKNDFILITGSNGFIGSQVLENLAEKGYNNLKCLVRKTSNLEKLEQVFKKYPNINFELYKGDLLNKDDCDAITKDVSLIYHVAAGMGGSFSAKFLNSVVTTRNLIDSAVKGKKLKKFLNVSSFSVYSNFTMKRGAILDENCPLEDDYLAIYNPYTFAKVEQDKMVVDLCEKYAIPYALVRPGTVYGPGAREKLTAHIGNKTFGILLHIGGSNLLPLTYINNCAEAIVLCGLDQRTNNKVINIVDDDKISSRKFLRLYKKNVFYFKSIYMPYSVFYLFSIFWEKLAKRTHYSIPAIINPRKASFFWKGNKYSNNRLKELTNWKQTVPFEKASQLYFKYMKETNKARKIC